jgi:hypothetical protein
VAIGHFTVRLDEDRHGESELADARSDLLNSFVVLVEDRARNGFRRSMGQYSTRSLAKEVEFSPKLAGEIDAAAGPALVRL